MTGWLVMGGLSLMAVALMLWLGKLPRPTWEALVAGVVLALAGYALQGSPALESSPAKTITADAQTAEALILTRSEMDRTFSMARPYLIASDAWARDGDYKLAASYIRSGIRKNPKNADLWAGLGLQLMLASEGRMSPPAQYAFDQARKYNPRQPAPDYFTGLVALFDGNPNEALRLWKGLLENASDQAKWKERLEGQVAGVEALVAQSQARETQRATAP